MFISAQKAAILTGVFVSFLAKKLGKRTLIIINAGIARAYTFNALEVAIISDSIKTPYPNSVVITRLDKKIRATAEGSENRIANKIALS